MSGSVVSPFLSTNELLAPMAAYDTHQNQLLKQQSDRQGIASNEMEFAARTAQGLLSLGDETKMAEMYPAAVAYGQQMGFLKNAPSAFPGKARLEQMVSLGIPAATQFEYGAGQTAAKGAVSSLGIGSTGTGGSTTGSGTGDGTTYPQVTGARGPGSATRGEAEGGPPAPGSPGAAVAQRVHDFWIKQGYSEPQVAGIMAGGPGSESDFTPSVYGDNKTSYGLYQHHGERLANMQKYFGLSGSQMPSEDQQNQYAAWEISPAGPLARVGVALAQAKTPEEAATIWTRDFGVPADKTEIGRRARGAGRYAGLYGGAPGGGVAARTGGTDVAGPGAGAGPPSAAPAATTAVPAGGPPMPRTEYTDPETGLPVVSGPAPAAPATAPAPATVDLTGPRPLPPTGAGSAVATPASLANTPLMVPQNAMGPAPAAPAAPPAAVAPAQAPAVPAAPAQPPAAPAAPVAPQVPLAPVLALKPSGLTAQQEAQALNDFSRPMKPADVSALTAHYQQLAASNLAANRQAEQQNFERTRLVQNDAQAAAEKAKADAIAAENLRLSQAADARAAEKWKAEQETTARQVDNPFGDSETGKLRYILSDPKSDPKSPTYHAAWAAYANPQTVNGVTMPGHVMTPFRMPLDADGVPVTTYDKPTMALAPGDLTQYRKITEQSGTLNAALDDFAKAAKNASLTERLKTVAGGSTDLRSAWTNLAMLAKGDALFQLGVLSGPDMDVMRGALADPSTFMGSMASTETIDKQVGRIKRILATRLDQAREAYLPGVKPADTPAKTETTSTTTQGNVPPPPRGFRIVQ